MTKYLHTREDIITHLKELLKKLEESIDPSRDSHFVQEKKNVRTE
jgi:hypothetical protein